MRVESRLCGSSPQNSTGKLRSDILWGFVGGLAGANRKYSVFDEQLMGKAGGKPYRFGLLSWTQMCFQNRFG